MAAAPHAFGQTLSSSDYQILTPTISSGGGYATSSSYSLLGTISQFSHELSSSVSYGLVPGFAAYPFITTPVVSAAGGNASVALSWTAANGVLGYSVGGYTVGESATSGGPYAFSNAGTGLSATISGLGNGTTYYFVVRVLDAYGAPIATSTEVHATPAAPPPPAPQPASSPGGGGPIGVVSQPVLGSAIVNFSGRAYPRSTITLLRDAQVVASTIADADADFRISLSGLAAGSYVFSVYSGDSSGNRSGLLSFPVSVTAGVTIDIGGIFISPTIDTDKSQVKQGDTLTIFGQSAPGSSVVIAVHSENELFLQAKTDAIGAYLYNLDTSPLELGTHAASSKAATGGAISDFGQTVNFIVGAENVPKKTSPSCATGDINCDVRVNLVDFSIMAYWYKRPPVGAGLKADLNHDGKVDLVDFSILASHWTG